MKFNRHDAVRYRCRIDAGLSHRLSTDDLLLCDALIGLDAFHHWFDDSSEDYYRPDLLRITVTLGSTGVIRVNAHLIECKVAKESPIPLEKARTQIYHGFQCLIPVFLPKQKESRFDERYWWAQLQRLIASKSVIPGKNQAEVTAALEKLGNGVYEIQWRGAAVAFWTDSNADRFTLKDEWTYLEQHSDLKIKAFTCGARLVERVCYQGEIIPIPFNEQGDWFRPVSILAGDETGEDIDSTEVAEIETNSADTRAGLETDEARVIDTNNEGPISIPEPEFDKPVHVSHEDTEPPVSSEIPEKIVLGASEKSDRKLYWEFGYDGLPNRHLLIFGKSGAGQSFELISGILHFIYVFKL